MAVLSDCQKTCSVTGIGGKDTIDRQGQTRLPTCLSGAFCPFRLGLRQQSLRLKNQKSLENTSLAGAEQFCRSRNVSRQEKTRREYLPYCQGA